MCVCVCVWKKSLPNGAADITERLSRVSSKSIAYTKFRGGNVPFCPAAKEKYVRYAHTSKIDTMEQRVVDYDFRVDSFLFLRTFRRFFADDNELARPAY